MIKSKKIFSKKDDCWCKLNLKLKNIFHIKFLFIYYYDFKKIYSNHCQETLGQFSFVENKVCFQY